VFILLLIIVKKLFQKSLNQDIIVSCLFDLNFFLKSLKKFVKLIFFCIITIIMNIQEQNNNNIKKIKKIKRPAHIITDKQILTSMINNRYKNIKNK